MFKHYFYAAIDYIICHLTVYVMFFIVWPLCRPFVDQERGIFLICPLCGDTSELKKLKGYASWKFPVCPRCFASEFGSNVKRYQAAIRAKTTISSEVT